MPCLSGSFNTNTGPLINVGVLEPGTLAPTSATPAQITTFPALIDTGASATCISPNVAQTVGLLPIGMRPMTSATHSVPVNVYLVDLLLPFGGAGFLVSGMQVMEFAPAGSSPLSNPARSRHSLPGNIHPQLRRALHLLAVTECRPTTACN